MTFTVYHVVNMGLNGARAPGTAACTVTKKESRDVATASLRASSQRPTFITTNDKFAKPYWQLTAGSPGYELNT